MNQNEKEKRTRARAQERVRKTECGSRTFIYIYTSSINHLHLRLPASLSSNKDKLSASHSSPLSRARSLFFPHFELPSHPHSTSHHWPRVFFSPSDTRDVVLQMTLIRKRARERAYKKSVITRLEFDEDASSCHGASERAASYYRSRVAAATATRK